MAGCSHERSRQQCGRNELNGYRNDEHRRAPDTAFSGGAISGIMCLRRARDAEILEGGPLREKMLTPTCGFTTCTSQHEVHPRFTQMPHEAAITSNGLYGSFSKHINRDREPSQVMSHKFSTPQTLPLEQCIFATAITSRWQIARATRLRRPPIMSKKHTGSNVFTLH
jgi:hypothetical protein